MDINRAIAIVTNMVPKHAKLVNGTYKGGYDNWESEEGKAIKAVVAAAEKQTGTDWIPVSERLPTKEEYCKNDGRFIVTDGNRVEQGIFDVYADGCCDPYWPYQSCQPTAWMPLPEPYKPE